MSNIRQEEDYEVFISYSHKDNIPPPRSGGQGWVTHFDELLEFFLREWRGEPKIWRDNVMRGSDVIDDAIFTSIPRVAVMIAVVSPNYLTSEWCAREREEFYQAASRTRFGIQVLNRLRIFKVAKVPLLEGQKLPDVFAKVLGFNFYDIKDKDKKPVFFGPHGPTEEAKQLFQDKVGDIAWEVKELLDILNEHADDKEVTTQEAPVEAEPVRKVSVYLAEPTPDLVVQRDNVRRDLLHRGYNVVQFSSEDSGTDAVTLEGKIRQDLESCGFSIHLVGDEWEGTPDTTFSIVELQEKLAAERAAESPDFQRLIWIPDNVKPQHHSQWRFVNALLDSNFERNTELLRRTLENFKTVIQDKINPPRASAPEKAANYSRNICTVGILCDRLDADRVARLDDCLFEQGCDVVVSVVDGGASALTDEHIGSLSVCDGIIIYMDSAPLFWIQGRLRDLSEIEGRGGKEFGSVAVYVGGPKTREKEQFRTRKATVIKNFEDAPDQLLGPIPPHLLQPFLDKLNNEEKGQVS